MIKFDSGAIREDKTGKGRMDLLPMCALIRLSKHYESGSVEHGERNWEKGIPIHSFIDSALRHIAKYVDGMDDEDHLCAAAWNILSAMWTEEKRPDMQDIPSRCLSFVSNNEDGLEYPQPVRSEERPQERPTTVSKDIICSCYCDMAGSPRCFGTKEMESCSCGGDIDKYDFYPTDCVIAKVPVE